MAAKGTNGGSASSAGAPAASSSKKKKKKKSGGGGGGASKEDDALVAERLQRCVLRVVAIRSPPVSTRFRAINSGTSPRGASALTASSPPSRRLMMLDLEPTEPEPEQWAKVSKGVSKSAAKIAAKDVLVRGDPTAVAGAGAAPACNVLLKFESGGGGDDDDDGDGDGGESLASKLSSYVVKPPFWHVFEDTGKAAWCAVVTSASGFDSAPIPIAASVPRVRKITQKHAPPVLEEGEEMEVILDFKRRQKEERKKQKKEEGGKKKKKSKSKSPEPPEATAAPEAEAPPEAAAPPGPLPGPPPAEDLSRDILTSVFASAPYQPPP